MFQFLARMFQTKNLIVTPELQKILNNSTIKRFLLVAYRKRKIKESQINPKNNC